MCPDEGGSPRLSTAQPLDEYDRLFALSLPRKGAQMDKGEAERLDRAIQRASVKWIQVQEITFDRCKNTELCDHYALLSRDFLHLEVERTAIIVLGRDVRKAMEKDQPA
jgi:hypothetical protein